MVGWLLQKMSHALQASRRGGGGRHGDPWKSLLNHRVVTLYIAKPPEGTPLKAGKGVLYLTDVFGLALNENKLLADSFARAGYIVVAPDMFNSTPATTDINVPGAETERFLAMHTIAVTDDIVNLAILYMRSQLGVKKIGSTGYCFGGKYSFRAAAGGSDAAFAAHPSNLLDAEISAIKGPASVAAAETDGAMSVARRQQIEGLLQKTSLPYSIALYGGTSHGFGVRANVSDPKQKFGKEQAFLQAVRWFDAWL
jgi:dienelactone hydrolase